MGPPRLSAVLRILFLVSTFPRPRLEEASLDCASLRRLLEVAKLLAMRSSNSAKSGSVEVTIFWFPVSSQPSLALTGAGFVEGASIEVGVVLVGFAEACSGVVGSGSFDGSAEDCSC